MNFKFTNLCSIHSKVSANTQFAKEVEKGLSLNHKRLPSWLIYDDKGSLIFQEINELEGYHPTYCETEILNKYKKDIAIIASEKPFNLIELGAGDGRKTTIILEYFLKNQLEINYIPIDVSEGAIKNLSKSLKNKFGSYSLNFHGLIADYFQGMDWLNRNNSKQNLVFFLGSSIGNFDLFSAKQFLKHLRNSLNKNDFVLIGFDLMKDPRLLNAAYNDPGRTFQKFNLHLLERVNSELEGNFNIRNFVQYGNFNTRSQAVESFIYSLKEQSVILKAINKDFHFDLWEGMQTEHSYKYTIPIIESLAIESGFKVMNHYFDQNHYFVDSLWKTS